MCLNTDEVEFIILYVIYHVCAITSIIKVSLSYITLNIVLLEYKVHRFPHIEC